MSDSFQAVFFHDSGSRPLIVVLDVPLLASAANLSSCSSRDIAFGSVSQFKPVRLFPVGVNRGGTKQNMGISHDEQRIEHIGRSDRPTAKWKSFFYTHTARRDWYDFVSNYLDIQLTVHTYRHHVKRVYEFIESTRSTYWPLLLYNITITGDSSTVVRLDAASVNTTKPSR